jgi:hypothetical protein
VSTRSVAVVVVAVVFVSITVRAELPEVSFAGVVAAVVSIFGAVFVSFSPVGAIDFVSVVEDEIECFGKFFVSWSPIRASTTVVLCSIVTFFVSFCAVELAISVFSVVVDVVGNDFEDTT